MDCWRRCTTNSAVAACRRPWVGGVLAAPAGTAEAERRQLDLTDGEVPAPSELVVHRRQQLVAEVPHRPTPGADEVVVCGLGRHLVVAGVALQPRLHDEIETHEQLERAVDGGDVDVGHRAPHLGRHFLGGHVPTRAAQHLPDEVPLRREAVTLLAKRRACVMHDGDDTAPAIFSQERRVCRNGRRGGGRPCI